MNNYFGNLRSGGAGTPNRDSAFYRAAELSFGRYDLWKTDFIGVAKIRGVGWAICYQDPLSKRLSNHWITSHEVRMLPALRPFWLSTVGACVFLDDKTFGAAQVHRGIFLQHRLRCG